MEPTQHLDQLKYASAESGYGGGPIHSQIFSKELPHPPVTVYDESPSSHEKNNNSSLRRSTMLNRHHTYRQTSSSHQEPAIKYLHRRDSSPQYLGCRTHPGTGMHRGLSSILIDTNGNPTTGHGGGHRQRLSSLSLPRSSISHGQWIPPPPPPPQGTVVSQQSQHQMSRSPSPPPILQHGSGTRQPTQATLMHSQQPLNSNVFSVSGPSLSIDPNSIVTSVQLAMHQVLAESSLNQSIDGRITDVAKEIIAKTAEVSVEKVLTAVEIRLAAFLPEIERRVEFGVREALRRHADPQRRSYSKQPGQRQMHSTPQQAPLLQPQHRPPSSKLKPSYLIDNICLSESSELFVKSRSAQADEAVSEGKESQQPSHHQKQQQTSNNKSYNNNQENRRSWTSSRSYHDSDTPMITPKKEPAFRPLNVPPLNITPLILEQNSWNKGNPTQGDTYTNTNSFHNINST